MRTLIVARFNKAVLLFVRLSARPMANRYKVATVAYYWSDLRCFGYAMKQVYVLPDWVYWLLKYVCNWISDKNVVDKSIMRCAWLQLFIEWVIHRIPNKIRFSEMLQQGPPPGQRGGAQTTIP